jgi:hypothetical protein
MEAQMTCENFDIVGQEFTDRDGEISMLIDLIVDNQLKVSHIYADDDSYEFFYNHETFESMKVLDSVQAKIDALNYESNLLKLRLMSV